MREAEDDRERLRVLIVDDDADACDIAVHVVRHLGHRPVCLQDSSEALRRIEAQSWDVILLDLVMPGLNGFDLLRAARAEAGPAIPVVAISSYGEFRHEALKAGFTAFIEKPLELAKMRPLLHGTPPAH